MVSALKAQGGRPSTHSSDEMLEDPLAIMTRPPEGMHAGLFELRSWLKGSWVQARRWKKRPTASGERRPP